MRPSTVLLTTPIYKQKRALDYPPVRAADVSFGKSAFGGRLDTREKMNLPFRYEKAPLFSILLEGIEAGTARRHIARKMISFLFLCLMTS